MAGRGGWGRGRGRGRGGGGYAKELPFDIFPEVDCIGAAKYSDDKRQLIKWSSDLHRHWKSSPYFYIDRKDENQRPAKTQKLDIERFSDRESLKTKDRSELRDFIMLDPNHMPGELCEGQGQRKRKPRKAVWNPELGLDVFEKLEKMQGNGEKAEKEEEEEEEEEEEAIEEEEGESDDGDYQQNRDFDDDEDDFNVAEDDDEPIY